MSTVLSPTAAKYLERMNEPIRGRIKAALKKLEQEPPQGDLTGEERALIAQGMAMYEADPSSFIPLDKID